MSFARGNRREFSEISSVMKTISKTIYIVLLTFLWQPIQAEIPEKRLFERAKKNEEGRFLNLAGELSKGDAAVRIPFMLRRVGTYFRDGQGAPSLAETDTEKPVSAIKDFATATWVGHATVLVQMEEVTILTDPIWSNWPSPIKFIGPRRFVSPGILIENLPPIDVVLISHNHYDHLDLPSLKKLSSRNVNTQFVVPLGNAQLLIQHGIANVLELDWGDTVTVNGASVICLPSQHWSKRSLTDTNKALWASWAVIGKNKRFYFAGDTGFFPEFSDIGEKLGPFDLAAIPIGAYKPRSMMQSAHLNPEEAIRAALKLQAKKVLAIHFGTFDLSDEPLAEPQKRFMAAAAEQSLGQDNAWVTKIGQRKKF